MSHERSLEDLRRACEGIHEGNAIDEISEVFLLMTVFGKLTLYIITSVCVFSILFLYNF